MACGQSVLIVFAYGGCKKRPLPQEQTYGIGIAHTEFRECNIILTVDYSDIIVQNVNITLSSHYSCSFTGYNNISAPSAIKVSLQCTTTNHNAFPSSAYSLQGRSMVIMAHFNSDQSMNLL